MKIALFTFLLFNSLNTFAQFQTCNSPTNKKLYDVHFVNQNTGVAVGDSGVIVRSIDGGLNWSISMTNDTVEFKKVTFFDHLHGIAIGSDLYRTTDGGITWSPIPHTNTIFFDVAILNDSSCLISGHPKALIKTTDKGSSFGDLIAQTNSHIGLLSFVNENEGYACNYGAGGGSPTLRTIDGGFSWDTLPSSPSTNTVMEAMSFASNSTGFKGGWYNGHLEKTTDSAQSWVDVNYTDSLLIGQIYDFHISASQPNAYYACGWYGEIFKSIDGGNNWFQLNSGVSNTTILYGVFFLNDSVGWVVGTDGTILKTTTGGITVDISKLSSRETLSIIVSPNPTEGNINITATSEMFISRITLYDLAGKLLLTKQNSSNLDISTVPSGKYFICIDTNKGIITKKIIKK